MDINDIINQNKEFLTKFVENTLERYAASAEVVWTSDLGMTFGFTGCHII